MDWAKTTTSPDENHLSSGIWCTLYSRFYSKLHFVHFLFQNATILNHEYVTDPPLEAYDLDRDINTPIGFSLDSGKQNDGII